MAPVPLKILDKHVCESNAIERMYVDKGDALYDKHLDAAKAVCAYAKRGELITPLEITSILFSPKWLYRNCEIQVGEHIMPLPDQVLALMEQWLTVWGNFHDLVLQDPDPSRAGRRAWVLHDCFVCIHPFRDGNGRTARLLLNSFRLCAGLPWHVVLESGKYDYYAYIRVFEKVHFRKWYHTELTRK